MKRMMEKIFRAWGMIAFLVAAGQGMAAEGSKPPAADLKALRAEGKFHEVQSVKELPEAVVVLCAGKRENLADTGQRWQVTDVVMKGENLPYKRLIWGATDGNYYVVHYERGGYAHTYHCLAARLKTGGGKAVVVWRGEGVQVKTYAAFVEAVVQGRWREDLFEKGH